MKKKLMIMAVLVMTFIFCSFLYHMTYGADREIYIEIPEEEEEEEEDVLFPYVDIQMTENSFKSYMGYKSLTSIDSPQRMLQELCITDMDGFRKCADRYVIAVGNGVGGQVGDCVDLYLQNGQVIYCVIGDYKKNIHTDAANITGKNGCCSEFIVDTNLLREDMKTRGNVSYGYFGWDSPVLFIRRYNINYLSLDLGGSVA